MRATRDRRRIVVLLDHDWAESQAFAREPVVALAADGFEVDVVARTTSAWTDVPGVRYHPRDSLRHPSAQAMIARLAADGLRERDCAMVIATPPVSLVAGQYLARLAGAPLVVLHDELWTSKNHRMSERLRRAMFRAHERAALTIITDLRRVEILEDEWPALRDHTFVELSNCPAGPLRARPRDEVRAELGWPADATVVLNAGSLTPMMGLHDVLRALPDFPENAFLVCQAGLVRPLDPALVELVEARYPAKFQRQPVPYDAVDDIVAASDIGIALYHSDLPNFRTCGKGSGKLNRYLRAGKPVIVDRNASLEWVAEYGAGVVIDDHTGIPDAIRCITNDYGAYAAAATKCFEQELSFETHWPVVRAALDDAMQSH
jgi:glycosyltransferase involved in cell wall biosynthesis